KPRACNEPSAPGGVSQPPFGRVSGVLAFGSPGSTTTASKFVNLTSPFKRAAITGTASGAETRRSDRIIDCPASVIVSPDDCGHTVTPMANTMARQVAVEESRPDFNSAAICVLLQSEIPENTELFRRR